MSLLFEAIVIPPLRMKIIPTKCEQFGMTLKNSNEVNLNSPHQQYKTLCPLIDYWKFSPILYHAMQWNV